MRIGLLHGYELSGSGSNEYTRYLARALARAGHEVEVLCREPRPEAIEGALRAFRWTADGTCSELSCRRSDAPGFTIHCLPHADVRPVFVTDKQRTGNVKAFVDLSAAELEETRRIWTQAVAAVLARHTVDVLHANHVVLQPTIAADACRPLGVPFVIYPHGSAIEYTVRIQERYRTLAHDAIEAAAGLIIGSREVQGRLLDLFDDLRDRIRERTEIVGVGVDTDLFSPISRSGRARSIARLRESKLTGGKPPELRAELRRRLLSGDIEAVRAQRDAYVHDRPDADMSEHLARIPWTDGKIVLFVGALTVGKGLQSVIAAMPAVLKAVPDAHLVIVGSGAYREVLEGLVDGIAARDEPLVGGLVSRGNDLDDTHLEGPWEDVLRHLVEPSRRAVLFCAGPRFAEHVHFLGRLDHELLRHLFPCADVAVFPSVIPEAYPLVLMESLSNGVLPAASSFSGFAEGLDLLVPHLGEELVERMRLPLEPELRVQGIADRLASLLGEATAPDLPQRLRAIAVAEYDWAVRAEAMVRAYRRFAG
ncbi:MAG: glycosyltransferase family 4 protein [Deltaproteobacteria bacterium]|nr:glycosyltransferase family 4 protein [Deltaproteobacteria bacterium]